MRRPRFTLAALAAGGLAFASTAAVAHEGPQPGQCYGATVRAPLITREAHRALIRPPHYEERVIRPGVIGIETRRTLIRPAAVERERIPALYRTVEHVVAHPGPTRWLHTPPEYRFEQVPVLIAPAHAEWRPRAAAFAYGGAAPGQTVVEPTGEVVCRVWCPARWGVEQRRVLVAPGRAYAERGATRYERFVERVMVRPASVVERRIPAVYRVERIQHLLQRPVRERVLVPGRVGTVFTERAHGGGRGWSRVICSGPLNPAFVAQMQGALNARGYDAGAADGRETAQTHAALHRFQHDRRMAEGQVTVESAEALGVAP